MMQIMPKMNGKYLFIILLLYEKEVLFYDEKHITIKYVGI